MIVSSSSGRQGMASAPSCERPNSSSTCSSRFRNSGSLRQLSPTTNLLGDHPPVATTTKWPTQGSRRWLCSFSRTDLTNPRLPLCIPSWLLMELAMVTTRGRDNTSFEPEMEIYIKWNDRNRRRWLLKKLHEFVQGHLIW